MSAGDAEASYRRDDERGDADAAFKLAQLLRKERGDLQGAESAYRRADGRGHPGGAFRLGRLLEERGDLQDAESAYRRAEKRGHHEGAFTLGLMFEKCGDLQGAEGAYRRAEKLRHYVAVYRLGGVLQERGDLQGAEAAYRRAEKLPHPDVARSAAHKLDQLRRLPRAPARAETAQSTQAPPGNAKKKRSTRQEAAQSTQAPSGDAKQERSGREKEESAVSKPARLELLAELYDAADKLGPVAERCVAASYGRDWLSHVNARRKRENPDLRKFGPAEVQGDPRAALAVIGHDPASEAAFGHVRAKARFLLRVANRLNHPHLFIAEAELGRAHRDLRELCEIARRLPDGPVAKNSQ